MPILYIILLSILYLGIGAVLASLFVVIIGAIVGLNIGSGTTPPPPLFIYTTFFLTIFLWPIELIGILIYYGYKKATGTQ